MKRVIVVAALILTAIQTNTNHVQGQSLPMESENRQLPIVYESEPKESLSVAINAEVPTKETNGYRNHSVAFITIKESNIGALTKGSEVVLDVPGLDFNNEFKVRIEGNIDIAAKVINGDIVIQTKSESTQKPSVIKITGLSLYSDTALLGKYSLWASAAKDDIHILSPIAMDKQNSNTNRVLVMEDYLVLVEDLYIGSDVPEHPDKVMIKIGAKQVYVDDVPMDIAAPAFISPEGYTMLPLRDMVSIFSNGKGNIYWNGEKREIMIQHLYGRTITIQTETSKINGGLQTMARKCEVLDGITYISTRDFCALIGVDAKNIIWDEEIQRITFSTEFSR